SILRRCFAIVGIGLLVLAWPPCRAAADTPAGCDGLTTLPVEGFLSRPQNLAVIKQQLLVYRRATYHYELERVVREAEASAPPPRKSQTGSDSLLSSGLALVWAAHLHIERMG